MTADLICYGIFSPTLFQAWLRQSELICGCKIIRYEHRSKSYGWGHFERVTWGNNRLGQKTRWSEGWKRDSRCLRPCAIAVPVPSLVVIQEISR